MPEPVPDTRIEITPIAGLLTIRRATHQDERGFFREPFRLNEVEEAVGRPLTFVQQNHARSRQGVLRGLHAEGWDKLIYVPHGEIFAALADIRPKSPTFRQIATFTLGETDRAALFIPAGLANGYCVLSEEADYLYLVTAYYDGTDTRAVAWNDPDLGIPWPLPTPILSPRDQANLTLRELLQL